MAPSIESGEVLAGKYRVERVLGRGGMGVVVAAMHEQLEQRVALKFLLAEGRSQPDAVARFLREAKAAVKLRSEHVAKVLDVGTLEAGEPYIVMEYLEGEELGDRLERLKRLSVTDSVDIILQACEAMAEAHRANIIHRDLKPANLFITGRPDGSECVKVLDFGISKLLGDDVAKMTATTSMLGTPYYMSPEQMRSSKNVSPRSDIWALGMILYEMLTGQVAFVRETLPELCFAIMTDPLPSVRERRPEVPAGLEAAVEKALAKDPTERFQTVAEMALSLAPYGSASAEAIARRVQRVLDGPGVDRASALPAEPKGDGSHLELDTLDAPIKHATPRTPRETPLASPARRAVAPMPDEATATQTGTRSLARWGALAAVALVGAVLGVISLAGRSSKVDEAQAATAQQPASSVQKIAQEPAATASAAPAATPAVTPVAAPVDAPAKASPEPSATQPRPGRRPPAPPPQKPAAGPASPAAAPDFGGRK